MNFIFSQQPGLKLDKKTSTNDNQDALVTIITPYYNAGKYFEQTFNSVINQTFPWFEWIIINDGSTDVEDIRILNFFSEKDKRIRVISQKNCGLACARNTGFANATTDIIIPLDADDLISPQYVEYTYFGLLFHPDASWCYTSTVGFGADTYLWKYPWDTEKLKTYNFLTCTSAIRKKAWEEIGGYKVEKQSYYEDWRFWLDMLATHKKPVRLCGYLFWYRRLNRSMLSDINKDTDKMEFSRKIIEKAAENINCSIEAVEYPVSKTGYPFRQPQFLSLGDKYKIHKEKGKIRLLMLIPWMVMGGADKFNLQLVNGLNKDIYEIGIITTVPSDNDWHQQFELLTDEIFHLPDFLDPSCFADFVSYYIESRMIDILLISNSQAGYYMAPWLKSQFPNLLIIDYVHMEEWYWKAGGHARTSAVLGEIFYKTYVCNHATRENMICRLGRENTSIKTVHIGVDHKEFDRTKVEKGYLYELLKEEQSRPLILFPCRVCPQKRPFLMLEIADKMQEIRNDILFVVIGDGEQLEELKTAIHNRSLENNVVCTGRCENMKSCYRDAFLTLICSLKEGLSLTAYESCSMGVPVISSDAGGQKDLIDHTVGALIPLRQNEAEQYDYRSFDETEIDEYVSSISEFLNNSDKYKTCSSNCRKRIESEFSLEKMIANMEQEIMEALKETRTVPYKPVTSGIYGELYTMFNLLEMKEAECAEQWNSRCYFNNLLQAEQKRTDDVVAEKERMEIEKNRIYADLQSIKNMRLYCLLEWYGRFVGKNPLGMWLWKLMRKILHKTES